MSAASVAASRRLAVASPRNAVALGLATLLLTVAAAALTIADHRLSAGDGGSVVLVPGFGLVGLLVARRQPANAMGWVLLGCAFFLALDGASATFSVFDYRVHHGSLPLGFLAVLLQPAWAPAIALLVLSILLFPDGELPAGRWRVVFGAFLGFVAIWLAGAYGIAVDAITSHRIHVDSTGNLLLEDHATGAWAWWNVFQNVFFVSVLVVALSWIAWQVPAFRRATGVRRAQLKWLMLGAATALAGGFLTATNSGGSEPLAVLAYVGTIALLGLPAGIGIGILRYRLYEIDRLISRTLSYALLTGLLVGVFAGLVLLTTRVLPFASPVGVAASTLAAASLFAPLRSRLQHLVDRHFNRARYDADALVGRFASRLRNAAEPDTVIAELTRAVARSLEPAHLTVWVRAGEEP